MFNMQCNLLADDTSYRAFYTIPQNFKEGLEARVSNRGRRTVFLMEQKAN